MANIAKRLTRFVLLALIISGVQVLREASLVKVRSHRADGAWLC